MLYWADGVWLIVHMLGTLCLAEITKANEEVKKVMNLYDEVINKADIGSLLVADDHSKLLDISSVRDSRCRVIRADNYYFYFNS